MRRAVGLLLAGLLLVSGTAWAHTERLRCGIAHFTRLGGAEMRTGVVVFNNGDLENPATIERFTIFDFFGNVAHDSGPAIGIPHPLNTDFASPVDITVVPPGATFYLSTNHIWDTIPIPFDPTNPTLNGNERGQSLSVVVEVSKEGKPGLFEVHGRNRSRQRFQPTPGVFTQGGELSSNIIRCFPVK